MTLKPVHSSDNVITRSQVFDHTFRELSTHLRELHDLEQEITAKAARNQTINIIVLPTLREQHTLSAWGDYDLT